LIFGNYELRMTNDVVAEVNGLSYSSCSQIDLGRIKDFCTSNS